MAPKYRIALVDEDGKAAIPERFLRLPIKEARELFEQEYLLAHIATSPSIAYMATVVQMDRSALHRKMERLGVRKPWHENHD
jgi:two-component system nitrogen regulation response regulator NtrX